jgi:hypothetical protein
MQGRPTFEGGAFADSCLGRFRMLLYLRQGIGIGLKPVTDLLNPVSRRLRYDEAALLADLPVPWLHGSKYSPIACTATTRRDISICHHLNRCHARALVFMRADRPLGAAYGGSTPATPPSGTYSFLFLIHSITPHPQRELIWVDKPSTFYF